MDTERFLVLENNVAAFTQLLREIQATQSDVLRRAGLKELAAMIRVIGGQVNALSGGPAPAKRGRKPKNAEPMK